MDSSFEVGVRQDTAGFLFYCGTHTIHYVAGGHFMGTGESFDLTKGRGMTLSGSVSRMLAAVTLVALIE